MNNKKIDQSRDNGLDLLRIVSAVAVILIHVNAYYFVGHVIDGESNSSYTVIVESIFNIITRFSVPCFVMISGAFNLNNLQNSKWRLFYCKSFYKVFIPTFAVSILFLVYDFARCLIRNSDEGFITIIKNIILGRFYNLWFMYMLLGLYLLTPFIVVLKKNISKMEFNVISIFMILWALISQALSNQKVPYSIGVVFAFLGYYMFGNVLYNYVKEKKLNHIFISFVVLCMVALTFIVRLHGFNYYLFDAYKNFFSPTIMVISTGVFMLFASLKLKCSYSKFASQTFYIYVFHTFTYETLYKIANKYAIWNSFNEIFRIVIVTLCTLIGSYILSLIYSYTWRIIDNNGFKDKWYKLDVWKEKISNQ